ncbi:MAG: F0F1 ATP synthase subunit delta [Oleiphilaceae bacterium]|uniref:ATP synthase subunit delta n=1 Tax=Spongiibacter thalassae TaxID=2721624 RepID=A0ABX1GGF2_9GAMM|nr:F0F1 ATP synthase subunit delta [Spongiibacter thalassae]MDX1453532.1 F0F1 ATP synthase subunit delta [Oleiphilaceae bacterium]NKI18284.1 F0F1 ATP synthase subunit delta [Spongiibacter thalassae]
MAELSTMARPYAKAAFEYALASSALAEWSKMLATAAAVANSENVGKLLASPSLTTEQQAQAFIDVCGDELNAGVQNFIRILAENKRLALLPVVSELFEAQKAIQEKTVDVELITAFPLDSESEQRLADALTKKLERQVKVHSREDRSLIGGIVVRTGDLVIDSSVRGRLAKLAEALHS